MKKVCLSIPIHTAIDVCEQQINNIFFFVKNSIIVLHVTADQSNEFYLSAKNLEHKYQDRVFVNSKRYNTHSNIHNVVGLATIHASNYEHVKALINFDTFSTHASNEMFMRFGVEDQYDNYQIGLTGFEPGYPGGVEKGWNDPLIKSLIPLMSVKNVYWGGVIEGAFFDTNIMDDIARIVLKMPGQPIPAEPLIFNTIALNLHPDLKGTVRVTWTNASQNATHEMIHSTMNAKNKFYSIKSIPRDIKDPLRVQVVKLLREKHGAP